MSADHSRPDQLRVGLCASCRHARVITSDRGSAFQLCSLSATNANFPKYPRLPVLRCSGYEEKEDETT